MGALRTFPVSVVVGGRRVVVVGDGEPAAGKLRLLAKTEAEVVLYSVAEGVASDEARRREYAVRRRWPDRDEFADAALAFVGTEDEALDRLISVEARAAGVPVNVVDRPELCDVLTPAFVDRAPVTIAISTEGAAPVLAGILRNRIEALLPPTLGLLAAAAGALRASVARRLAPGGQRLSFWRQYFGSEAMAQAAGHGQAAMRRQAETLIEAVRADPGGTGMVWLVGAGPGAADLITLRAQRVLAEADVAIHAPGIGSGLRDHVRRDARRVEVGQDAARLAAAEARRGQRVVWLIPGDPASDPAARKEIAALRAAGIATAVVPGVGGARDGAFRLAPAGLDEAVA